MRLKLTGLLIVAMLAVIQLPVQAQTVPFVPYNPNYPARTFAETGETVHGVFMDYWDRNGGLSRQGYPISPVMQRSEGGETFLVQYFERAVFEWHTQYAGSPYEILLELVGSELYHGKYEVSHGPAGVPGQKANTTNSLPFPETGKTLGGAFRTYWEANGGRPQFGVPISDEFQEVSELDGKVYTVQFFERSAFEYHPEHAGTPFEILLSQLGTYTYNHRFPRSP
jgi:hypothetical protein